MTTIKIDTRQLDRLRKSFKESPKETTAILKRTISASLATLAKNTKRKDPVPYKSGRLLQSFREQQSGLIGRWFPNTVYAEAVDNPATSRSIFKNYMKKIVDNSQKDIDKLFEQAADKLANKITK